MLTKLGKAILREEDRPGLISNTALGLGGAAVVRGQLNAGNLTGRELLYHGTHPNNVESIKANGLMPTTDSTAVNTRILKESNPSAYKESMGKTYLTGDKMHAAGYAAGAKTRPARNPNPLDVLQERLNDRNIVQVKAPVWKMKTVRNPETAMGYDAWKRNLGKHTAGVPDSYLKSLFDAMDSSTVVEGGLPAEYIRGQKYKAARPGEVLSYIRNNKLRALKGYGLAGLGVGAAYIGGRNLYNRYVKDYE